MSKCPLHMKHCCFQPTWRDFWSCRYFHGSCILASNMYYENLTFVTVICLYVKFLWNRFNFNACSDIFCSLRLLIIITMTKNLDIHHTRFWIRIGIRSNLKKVDRLFFCSIYYVLQLIFSDRQKPAVFPVPHVNLYSQGKHRKHSLPFYPSVPE